jgi:hypothetical protein
MVRFNFYIFVLFYNKFKLIRLKIHNNKSEMPIEMLKSVLAFLLTVGEFSYLYSIISNEVLQSKRSQQTPAGLLIYYCFQVSFGFFKFHNL